MKRIFILMIMACGLAFAAPSGSKAQTHTTIGYSYVRLNEASYQAIEIGTSVVGIAKKGFVRVYGGTEVSVPLFFDAKGSNIDELSSKGSGFGVALQVPAILGIDIGGFYIQAMGGYNLSWMDEAVKTAQGVIGGGGTRPIKNAKTKTISQGFIYGGGIGFNFSQNFTIGARYIRGSMNNKVESDIEIPEFKTRYKTNYEKFMILAGYAF